MKKLLILFLSLILVAGCGQKKSTEVPQKDNGQTEKDQSKSKIATFGVGHYTTVERSENAKDGNNAKADAQITVVAVAFDAEGKIIAAKIDGSHEEVKFDGNMKFAEDYSAKKYQSTKLLKDSYKMKDASPIKKEWYEQVNHLEKWLVGKTVSEALKGMNKDSLDADLKSGATIQMGGFAKALEKAESNKVEVKNAAKLGLGLQINVQKPKAETDKPCAQFNFTFAAVVLDEGGKIVKTSFDTAQAKANYNMEGVLQNEDKNVLSKKDLKEKYNMKDTSPIKKEWYEQANAIEDFLVGKDEKQALELKTKHQDEKHPNKLDEPELKTSATIDVTEIKEALSLAFADAK